MTRYISFPNGQHFRHGYSVDIETEGEGDNARMVAYVNAAFYAEKRSKVGPRFTMDHSHRDILSYIQSSIVRRWPDSLTCPTCGR